jgi:hypothetical protein
VFVFSKLWYLAQILPLPQSVATRATSLAGAFLWSGHMERLAWQELHHKRQAGGLGVSCIFTRGQALLASSCAIRRLGAAPLLPIWLPICVWPLCAQPGRGFLYLKTPCLSFASG